MPTQISKGLLIAVEGIDGAGKTTQVEALRLALENCGESVVVSKEPTDGPWGKRIKESATKGRLPLGEELDAFLQDRTEHVDAVILPALTNSRTVILDRYFYSTIAYQGSRGADVGTLTQTMEDQFPVPDAVFVLDLDPTISLDRIHYSRRDTPNAFEQIEGLRTARTIFRQLTGDHIYVLNAAQTITELHQEILNLLIDGPLKVKRCAKQYCCENPFDCAFRIRGKCEWYKLQGMLRPQESIHG